MFKTPADAARLASLARAMASNPSWGSKVAFKLLENAAGRIEASAGEFPSLPLQGIHASKLGLDDRSDEIAVQYGLPAPEHRLLISAIELQMNTIPAEVLKSGQPGVTIKSSKWRPFLREAAPQWRRQLSYGATPEELFVLAVAIDGDQLLFEVSRHVGAHARLIRLMGYLEAGTVTAGKVGKATAILVSVLKKMMAYKAPKSPPSFDKSVVDAAAEARNFWIEHGKKATVEFSRHGATEPKSEFARWFCAIMAAAGDLEVVQCRSLLDKHV